MALHLVTTAFERAATVTARPDGSAPDVRLPGEESRTREFARRPGTLPPGIDLVPEPDYHLGEDLIVGQVALPSGRVIVGEYLFDAVPLDFVVAPGRYPVHATLSRYGDAVFDNVAYTTLVLSSAPTVRWLDAGSIAVDGGTAIIISVEGRDALAATADASEDEWLAQSDAMYDSLVSHDSLATLFDDAAGQPRAVHLGLWRWRVPGVHRVRCRRPTDTGRHRLRPAAPRLVRDLTYTGGRTHRSGHARPNGVTREPGHGWKPGGAPRTGHHP